MIKTYSFLAFVLVVISSFSQNNCLDFDGNSDYVNIGSSLLPTISENDAWTVEVWIKTTSIEDDTIFSQYIVPNTNRSHINVDTTVSYWKFSSDYVVTSTTHINDGIWHHIAIVKEGSGINQVHLYVDGVLEDSGTDNYPMADTNVEIGRIDNSADYRYFPGQLDEIRIWSIARTQTEIQNNMNIELLGTETGLISYYNFNQGVAGGNNAGITILKDNTANANSGNLNTFSLNGATSNWVDSSTLSLDTHKSQKSTYAFPNPVSDVLIINSKISYSSIELYNYQGRKVFESNYQNQISVKNFSAGMYILKMNSSSGIFTKKIIIK